MTVDLVQEKERNLILARYFLRSWVLQILSINILMVVMGVACLFHFRFFQHVRILGTFIYICKFFYYCNMNFDYKKVSDISCKLL